MAFDVEAVVERLEHEGVRLDRGLTEADVKRIEKKYGFSFGPGHRDLLRTALPLGDAWLNWRHATPAKIRERLQVPIDSMLARVLGEGFWAASWDPRPDSDDGAERLARTYLAAAPVLVPLYGSSYLPGPPAPADSPVFRADGTGISLAGGDLLGYVTAEFGAGPAEAPVAGPDLARIEFWSDVASV